MGGRGSILEAILDLQYVPGIQSGLLWDLSPGNGQGSKQASYSHRPAGALGEEQAKLESSR